MKRARDSEGRSLIYRGNLLEGLNSLRQLKFQLQYVDKRRRLRRLNRTKRLKRRLRKMLRLLRKLRKLQKRRRRLKKHKRRSKRRLRRRRRLYERRLGRRRSESKQNWTKLQQKQLLLKLKRLQGRQNLLVQLSCKQALRFCLIWPLKKLFQQKNRAQKRLGQSGRPDRGGR